MQFKPNTPNIPNELVEAHIRGEVVFFCGAGVSMPTLPDFKSLVDSLYARCGTTKSDSEQKEACNNAYDRAITLLEKRISGGRNAVRRHLSDLLTISNPTNEMLARHKSILKLSKYQNETRLVTTNFDHLFEQASDYKTQAISAPLLPPAKRWRWNGLAYIHGRLPDNGTDTTALNNLVLSSGDFGLAYLTEGWAAKFVSELFRNFTVVFIGYSINDPPLRYIMDALSAEQQVTSGRDESKTAYAFADGTSHEQTENEWKNKGVTPVLYENADGSHSVLTETLNAWAGAYTDGLQGRKNIIDAYTWNPPMLEQLSTDDDIVGRMLWALTDGNAVKHFVEIKDTNGNHAPYSWFELFDSRGEITKELLQKLSWWLTENYLEYPQFLLWAEKHPQYTDILSDQIASVLARCADQIADKRYITLWHLFCDKRTASSTISFRHAHSLKTLTGVDLLIEVKLLIKPMLAITDNHSIAKITAEAFNTDYNPNSFSRLKLDWVFACDEEYSLNELREFLDEEEQMHTLFELFESLQVMLVECLDISEVLGNCIYDFYFSDSIAHLGTRHSYPHNAIEHITMLLRDSWKVVFARYPDYAVSVAKHWFGTRHSVLQRLGLYAATQSDNVDWIEFVTRNEGINFWKHDLRFEVRQLIIGKASGLPQNKLEALIRIVCLGEPRDNFQTGIRDAEYEEFNSRHQFAFLTLLSDNGAALNDSATALLSDIKSNYPDWTLNDEERNARPFGVVSFVGGNIGNPHCSEYRMPDGAENDIETVLDWLKKWGSNDKTSFEYGYSDVWSDFCKQNYETALAALVRHKPLDMRMWYRLYNSETDNFSADKSTRITRCWEQLKQLLWDDFQLSKTKDLHILARLLCRVCDNGLASAECSEMTCFCKKTLCALTTLSVDELSKFNPTERTMIVTIWDDMAHIIVKTADASSEDYSQKCILIQPLIDCISSQESLLFVKQALLQYLNFLYVINTDWTAASLLPMLSWKNNAMAAANWDNFLMSRHTYNITLLQEISVDLFATAHHYDDLKIQDQYAYLLCTIAVYHRDAFDISDIQNALGNLPCAGISKIVWQLWRCLDDSEDIAPKSEIWSNRIEPVINLLPKDRDKLTADISGFYAMICVSAGDMFPTALSKLRNMIDLSELHMSLSELHQTSLCSQFPSETLDFLSTIFNGRANSIHIRGELSECLNRISAADNTLTNDQRLIQLRGAVKL
jgi:hypothetical protein